MSVPKDKFVIYKCYRASGIGSTPTLVLPKSDYVCIVDSIILSSNGKIITDVFIYCSKETEEDVFKENIIFENLKLNPPQVLEAIKDSMIVLNPGEELYAYSDDNSKKFNCNISYREFTELYEE